MAKDKQVKISKPKVEKTDKPDISVLNGWYKFADQAAKQKQWDFFVIDQFLRGNHNIKANMSDNSIEIDSSDYIAFPINKMYANFRAVRSFVTRNKPKIDVEIIDKKDQASLDYARRANVLLQRDNRLNNIHRLNKEWVFYGVKYGIGWRQIGYDRENHVTTRWTVDPNDIKVGSQTGKAEDAPFIIKDVIRTVGYWKQKYPKAQIVPDNKLGTNEYAELSKEIEKASYAYAPQRENEQTMVGHECWYRVFEKNSMGGTINKCLFTETEILETSDTPYNEFPFIAYEADTAPNEIYPEGHMKHLIAPQRLLDLLNKDLTEYNFLTNKGTYQYEKGSGFEVIEAKEGRMIRHNQGKPITPVPPPPLNPAIQWQINYIDQVMQTIGAQNDASQGQVPFAGASGDLVEALQTADSNSIYELRENFEDALALEAKMILKMYDLFESDGITLERDLGKYAVNKNNNKNNVERFKIYGKTAIENTKKNLLTNKDGKVFEDKTYMDYALITSDNNVKVSLTSELGETKEARLNTLVKLVELNVFPASIIARHLEFPNTDELERELAEEAVADLQMEATKNALNPQAMMGQGQPAGLPPRQ